MEVPVAVELETVHEAALCHLKDSVFHCLELSLDLRVVFSGIVERS